MDWPAAKSYYIGYDRITRFSSLVFLHNYLFTWSISIFFALIPPLLFICAPSSLRTTRTSHFLIISIVCLSNICSLYIHAYLISNKGEPNLSYHVCRFVVYISTWAKPIGLYLTLLFSIERLFSKILLYFLLQFINYRQLFKKLYTVLIFVGTILIFSVRLYEVLKLIQRNQSFTDVQPNDTDIDETYTNVEDRNKNSTDRIIKFIYCFNSMNIDRYAIFLSFYTIQYLFEIVTLSIIGLILLIIVIHQCLLPLIQRPNIIHRLSVNTKLYLALSSSVVASESILFFLHLIVDDINNNNTNVQDVSLEVMLFAHNFRCLCLPLIICIMNCDPLKQFFNEIFITRSYLDYIDENDTVDKINNDALDLFSSTQRKNHGIQQNFRLKFTKNKSTNDREYLNSEES